MTEISWVQIPLGAGLYFSSAFHQKCILNSGPLWRCNITNSPIKNVCLAAPLKAIEKNILPSFLRRKIECILPGLSLANVQLLPPLRPWSPAPSLISSSKKWTACSSPSWRWELVKLFCSTSLPLANSRLVQLTFSSLCPLYSKVKKSQQHLKILENIFWERWETNQGWWVRSKNAASVLCSPTELANLNCSSNFF